MSDNKSSNQKLNIKEASSQNELQEVIELFSRYAVKKNTYISHSEIQFGYSDDGMSWSSNAAEHFQADFTDIFDAPDQHIIVGYIDDMLVAAASVSFEKSERRHFCVLQDLLVNPKARSSGVGAEILSYVESMANMAGADWVFLESGSKNHRAHSFFAQYGFEKCSHIFGKRLS